MTKENQKPTHRDVVPSVINFLSDELFEGDYKEQPLYLQEIFEILLRTEYGNDLDLRQKMLSCLRTSRNFAEALSPFSDKQIYEACADVNR
ncbi:hypothetical protein [Flavobacterium defluvii]|uniref:Uncharacterized protein n=1 Tax=Flavobacterium defluvii TaxID=370979 RepID=A0A1M5Q733_9FLAO|nr:hypothetical protein [Flavobacterium defluvii]SHH09828.1 hypothetical protein SAMN05443663_105246 [Flavobacterium defluvii]